jgi:hypothetical protein
LRVKAARRLASFGAVALKNAVYVLPDHERHLECLVWLVREIEEGGGRVYICRASFDVAESPFNNAQVKQLFVAARDADYRALLTEYQPLFEALTAPGKADAEAIQAVRGWVAQLRSRFEAVFAVDFFGAQSRESVEGLLAGAGRWLRLVGLANEAEAAHLSPEDFRGRTWVTRPGLHVDRIASAWLVRRFIDSAAVLRFDGQARKETDVRFDMPEAEFTHSGDQCTFETLMRRFSLGHDPALLTLGEVVHDIDLHEERPARRESAGFAALLNGLCLRSDSDQERFEQGSSLLDSLYEHFRRMA